MVARVVLADGAEGVIAVQTVERQYKVAEVADLLCVGVDWVYSRIKDGTFTPVVELGTGRANQRIPASVVQAFIDANTHPA